MKKILNIIAITAMLVITGCTDESKFNNPVHFELENGAFIRFENDEPNLTYSDAQNIFFSDEIYDANGNAQSYSLGLTATIGGVEYEEVEYFATTTFPVTLEITSESLASAIGIDPSTIDFGDKFDFNANVVRDDGKVFNVENTDSTLLTGTSYNDAIDFTMIVSCPFVQSEIIGKYAVVSDAWADYSVGDILTVVAGESTNTYRILQDAHPFISNASENLWLEVTVDAATGSSTAQSNDVYDYTGWRVIPEVTADEGLTLSCVGLISLELNFWADASSGWFGYNITLEKVSD